MPLKSTAAGDVVAAARQSALFRNHQTAGDGAHDLSHLGAPVFVRALRPAGMDVSDAPDFYVIPVLDTTGATTDAAELELNPQHTAIHVIAIVSYNTPRPSGAIAQMRAEDAIALAARANVAPLRAAPPALVYFPADATAQQTGQIVWRAGGEFPADPLWLVTGGDGRSRVIGEDGAIYTLDQLPMQR